jgi:hypothetical protein
VEGPSSYTAFGFANPLRHVLANVLGTKRSVKRGIGGTSDASPDRLSHLETSTVIVEPVETYLYRPLRSAMIKIANAAKRLQSGRLNTYVAYMLVAVLAALAIVSVLR